MGLEYVYEYVFEREIVKGAKCNAIDVAKYIVTYCNEKGAPITNLKLQYILYLCWKKYFSFTKSALFADRFVARRCGPVNLDAYYEFSIWAGNLIMRSYEVEIEESCRVFIQLCVDKYMEVSVSKLATDIQRDGSPWHITWKNGEFFIPFYLISKQNDGGQ